jgi:predicted RNase H-like nuclease (RuvC/YqgF family)
MSIKDQGQEILKLKKQVSELESKLNNDRQNQEIANLKNQVKDLKSRLNSQQNSTVEYMDINGKKIPVYRD